MGHIVGRFGLQPSRSNVEVITDFITPRTVRQLRRFLGMANFYEKLIPDSAHVMRPLYELTSARTLKWNTSAEEAFVRAKEILGSAPLLAYPDYGDDHPFILTVDASSIGAGAVLSQVQGDNEHVIAYAGVSFNKA